ncbi:hypothetical protein AC578_1241 [Pseudocercospora eumusae]|uniref:Uncharacterized protein n=1 Tax=Pseudocercospora eumusae TaxID=321146 RepID=A0A139HCT3_9PEZI|nr:hypothetical protein AC578_1241 [Pseudocercospora eumusae]
MHQMTGSRDGPLVASGPKHDIGRRRNQMTAAGVAYSGVSTPTNGVQQSREMQFLETDMVLPNNGMMVFMASVASKMKVEK